uniref:Cystatin domain-containing protein n=1 Tax=Strongyloides venezuelensis TaxID=75913 RepID=A0A0K0EYW8_STRVS
MKYLSIFIVLAIVIFVTINAKKCSLPFSARRLSGPPEWEPWNGRRPLNAKFIAKEATKLFFECGYHNFKFIEVYQKQKRCIEPAMRYRVRYYAKKCNKSIVIKTCKKKKRNKKCKKVEEIRLVDCYHKVKQFQAIFKDDVHNDRLRLNVTNLENGNSCALVIKYNIHNDF